MYVIDYTDGIRTVYGPFSRIQVKAIHTTIPHVCNDTISFYVSNGTDDVTTLTVSMVHEIVTNTEEE